jgi:hypothetical protein
MAQRAKNRQLEEQKAMSDGEILSDILDRFKTFEKIVDACIDGDLNGICASGAPGIGKSHTAESKLEARAQKKGNKYTIQKGFITPVMLYVMLYEHRQKGQIVVLDDADSVFAHEDALNIIKGALDSGKFRKISWMSDSSLLREKDIPNTFNFEGALIFLTNRNFEVEMALGSKMREHYEAFLNRTIYLDLRLHTPRQLTVWVTHLVKNAKILIDLGLKVEQEDLVLKYIKDNADNLRSLSIRTALQLGGFMKMGNDWERMANMTLLKTA